jgi:hypothetical protein
MKHKTYNLPFMKKYILALSLFVFSFLIGYSQENTLPVENKNSFNIIFENGFLIGNPALQYPMPFSSHLTFAKTFGIFSGGIGSGAEVIGQTYIPLYADIRFLPFKSKPFYLYSKGGYNFCISDETGEENVIDYNTYESNGTNEYDWHGGIMGEIGFGVLMKWKTWENSISLGFRYQKTSYDYISNSTRTYENYYHRLALRIGFRL